MKKILKALGFLFFLFVLGVLVVSGLIFTISLDLPQINSLRDYNPPMNSQILSHDGEVLLEIGRETREVVPFEDISPNVVDAFLAAEDDNFFQHEGIDYLGILRAFVVNLKAGRLVQGGSTITQQVAKSFLLSKERTISRKIKDLLLARKIEQRFSKEEILFLYLNQVYLGGGYYGVKAAIKGYFDKELSEATHAEAALVAGLLVAPGKYSPYVNPHFAKIRQQYVLKRMFETGKMTKEEYELALEENIQMRIRKPYEMKAGYFTDWIRQEVMHALGTEEFLTNGYRVQTTLDWTLQQKAEAAVKEKVKELDKRQGFKGPIKFLKNDEEIMQFQLEIRRKLAKDLSTYFIFNKEGDNVFEFSESDEEMEIFLERFKAQKENWRQALSRHKLKAWVGNPHDQTDFLRKLLAVDKSYEGVVLEIDDKKRTILVDIGGVRGIIPESGYSWAYERDISEEPKYRSRIKYPSQILRRGDVVLVQIEKMDVSEIELSHEEYVGKIKKFLQAQPLLKEFLSTQSFLKLSLDQFPEAEGALVSLEPQSGKIISLVGGFDFEKSQFNRALQSLRQPGSAFKPFIYAAALENGYTPSTLLMDSPQALGGANASLSWKPRNYDGDFKGPMTLRNALEVSRNIPTIRLVQDLGVEKIHDFIARIGLKAEIPKDMSLSLGSFGISLLELTRGYAIFPNKGQQVMVQYIESITDRDGRQLPLDPLKLGMKFEKKEEKKSLELIEHNNESHPFLAKLNQFQVYDSRLSFLMNNLLRGVIEHGTGRAASSLGVSVGGKTGTTNNYVDALFVGFSSNLVVGTWVGFDNNQTLGYGETGSKTALPIWKAYMKEAVAKLGAPEFEIPEGMTSLLIDKKTGKPVEGESEGFLEYFVSGHDPNQENHYFDQMTANPEKSSSLDDGDYWENQ